MIHFNMCSLRILIFAILGALVTVHIVSSNDVIGCGGFVESSVSINYSPIQIKLYTGRGVLKYTSDCAPNNGYYFIPLYDAGDYVLRIEPPAGWSFDPQEVTFNFDGKTDICSKQTDINFVFKGFAIFGKVFSVGSLSGPSGVSVTLLSKANNNVIKQNVTLEGGLFAFHDIFPGQYVIEASHDRWKFAQNRITFEVVNDNIDLRSRESSKEQLQVLGYSASGRVASDGQPIKGVQFALFAKDGSSHKIPCNESVKPSFVTKLPAVPKFTYACHASSNTDGNFLFHSLPLGKYILYSFYQTQSIRFEVSPVKYEFEVSHGDLEIEQIFEIGGFTVFGSVVNIRNPAESIDDAQVMLFDQNGKNEPIQVDVIPGKGAFTVENIKTSKYLIKVSAKHYQFEDIVHSITPNTPNLPIISPSKFEVCGHVKFGSFNSKFDDLYLLIFKKDGKTIFQRIPIQREDFCFFLNGGDYQLKMSSKHRELKFAPETFSLRLDKPYLNLLFKQFSAVVSGHIELRVPVNEISPEKLRATLTSSLHSGQNEFATAALKPISMNRFKFQFSDVLPGEYVASLVGGWTEVFCFESDSIKVTINDANIDDILFKQKGSFLKISLSHSTDLLLESPSGKQIKISKESIESTRSVQQCLGEIGVYRIVPQGCHKFSETNENIEFDTTKPDAGSVLTMNAVQHLVTANVRSASNLTDLSVKISVNSLDGQHVKSIGLKHYTQLESGIDGSPIYQYSLSFYESPMVDIRLEPVSSQLLFKPNFFEFVLKDDCYHDAVTFHGRFGLFIDGSVKPSIANVSITLFNSDTNEVVLATRTDSEGKYSGGPFDDDIKLRIDAAKDGFIMKPLAGKFGHFEARKLSSIVTTIVGTNSEPLSEVLVSLSGGENNFRKNSVVNANGVFNFDNLQPGQYFIRFMRKEYEFEPGSEMITLKSGDKHSIKVVGKKVAFSCLGTVNSLNGEPEAGVVVEAIGLRKVLENSSLVCSQFQEQAVSETDGSFRILGLHPECQYAIRLKIDDNENYRESIPRLHSVRVQNSDITDLRFIVLYKQFQMDLSLNIKTEDEFLPSLTVQLFRDDSQMPLFKQTLSTSPFVFLPAIPLDGKQNVIRIDSDLSPAHYHYLPIMHTFIAEQSQTHLQFEFKPKSLHSYASATAIDVDATNRPMYAFPLLVLIVLFFYHRQVIEFLRNLLLHRDKLFMLINRQLPTASSTTNGTEFAAATSATKKKNKTKKVN